MAEKKDIKRKFKDYYQVLGVDRTASDTDIENAYYNKRSEESYNAQKLAEIETAYSLLRDPELRQKFDEILVKQQFTPDEAEEEKIPVYDELPAEKDKPSVSPLLKRIFALVLVVGIGVGIWLIAQNFYRFKSFAPGDTLYTAKGEIVGTISAYEAIHLFPSGKSAPAYLIRKQDATEIWYPASDIRALYTNIAPEKKTSK